MEVGSLCCACGACLNICPKNAIHFEDDREGIPYPIIDFDKCINCRKCITVCPMHRGVFPESLKTTFAAVSTDTDLSKSASGGIFASIASNIIRKNGIVYGSELILQDGKASVKHIRIVKQSDLKRLLGSKYIQSQVGFSFRNTLEDLESGHTVLYCGTPCQIAGLKSYLGREYDNLFTIDLVCHGVPSETLFNQYLAYLKKKYRGNIKSFTFRDKSKGWKLHGKLILEKGSKYRSVWFEPAESSFYQLFLDRCTYRESCYECPYAGMNRSGDITIGDYWCIELVHPEYLKINGGQLETEKGCSVLVINNLQGHRLVERYGSGLRKWESDYTKAAQYNAQLLRPGLRPKERDIVFQLSQKNYNILERWYFRRMLPIRVNRLVRRMVPKPVKQFIKNVFS